MVIGDSLVPHFSINEIDICRMYTTSAHLCEPLKFTIFRQLIFNIVQKGY